MKAAPEELKKEKEFHEFYEGCMVELGFKYFSRIFNKFAKEVYTVVCNIHDFPNFPLSDHLG